MDRADAARMAGAPGLEQVERLGAANLADGNPVGPQPQRGAHQIRQRGDAVLGTHGDKIGRCALQLARVLDQHDAVVGLGDFGEQRIRQCGLAGRCAPGDENVASLGDRQSKHVRLVGGHDAGGDIVAEREDRDGGLADGEGRGGNDRRQKPLEPLPRLGQLGGDARGTGMDFGADVMGDQAHDALAIGGRQALPRIGEAFGKAVDPEPAIGVEHHLNDARILKESGDGRTKRGAQHARAPDRRFGFEVRNRHVVPLPSGTVRPALDRGSVEEAENRAVQQE